MAEEKFPTFTTGVLAGKAKTSVASKKASAAKLIERMKTPAYWANQTKNWLKQEAKYVAAVKKQPTSARAKALRTMAAKKVAQAKANYKKYGGR